MDNIMTDKPQVALRKSGNIVSRQIDSEVILVPIRQKIGDLQCIYTTNDIGSFIWELIDGNRTFQDILDVIVSEYDVAPDEARADLEEFINHLVETGCIDAV